MADQEWVRPAQPQESAGTAWAGKPAARFELRPLSLGEVLDRTFALYRSRFWLFAGIAMTAAAVNMVGQGVSLAAAHKLARSGALTPATSPAAALLTLRTMGTAQLGSYLVALLFFLITAVTQAATALALGNVYLERPASVKLALGTVVQRWYRYIGIQFWRLGSFLWVPAAAAIPGLVLIGLGSRSANNVLIGVGALLFSLAVLAGVPVGIILYMRNSLAIPAAVTEGLTIRPAMRRSKLLAAGTKGRIFVVGLVAVALLEVVAVLQTPISLLMVAAPNQEHYLARGLALLITFVGHTVVSPVGEIGMTLLYFDQRVRKEALDLQLLLEGARGPGASRPPHAETTALAEGYAPLQ